MMQNRRRILTVVFPILVTLGAALPATGASLPVLRPATAEPIDLLYDEPSPVRDVYRSIGKAFGIGVLFDPKFRDVDLELVLRGVGLERALERVGQASGSYYEVLDGSTIVVADDTPQNRRLYETQVVQTLPLDNVRVADAMTALRSLIGLKHVSANETLDALVLRDTADRVAVAADLIEILDQPRGEVALEVELLGVAPGTLRSLGQGGKASGTSSAVLRLDAAQLARLRKAAGPRVLAHTQLGVLDGERGRLAFADRVPIRLGSESTVYQEVGIEIELTPEVHPGSGEVTLHLELGLSSRAPAASRAAADGPVFGSREVESSLRVGDGQSVLVAGLFRIGGEGAAQHLLSPFDDPGAVRGDLALVLTPRIVRGTGFTDADLEPYVLGTEAHIARQVSTP